jgi:hypothetical protein
VAQIAFSGFPLLCFLAFALTVFINSLLACILLAILAASLVTIVLVSASLLVILPILCVTTFAASSVSLLGLAGFTAVQWLKRRNMPGGDGYGVGRKIEGLPSGSTKLLVRQEAGHEHTTLDGANLQAWNSKAAAGNSSQRTKDTEAGHSEKPADGKNQQIERPGTPSTAITDTADYGTTDTTNTSIIESPDISPKTDPEVNMDRLLPQYRSTG